jgi:hypothetical protein
MIVSYKHNYIYIRPKKTGSTTIEAVLSDSLGPGDLITGKPNESVRHRLNINHVHCLDTLSTHLIADEVTRLVTPEFWQQAYKFASARHPYEKAVSMAYYRLAKRGLSADDFPALLEKTVRGGEYRSFDHYHIGGTLVVQDFIRLETLHEDLQRVGAHVGVKIPRRLPRKKGRYRLDRRPAREILSPRQREKVIKNCHEEFDLLDYER